MKTILSGVYLDKGVAAVALLEETLTDGSKVYQITIGEHEVDCTCEKRAVQSFTEIASAIRNAAVNGLAII